MKTFSLSWNNYFQDINQLSVLSSIQILSTILHVHNQYETQKIVAPAAEQQCRQGYVFKFLFSCVVTLLISLFEC